MNFVAFVNKPWMLEDHYLDMVGVTGSIPVAPTIYLA
jgi:hypothetical protein